MINKKRIAKFTAAVLAAAVVCSGFGNVPSVVYAAETEAAESEVKTGLIDFISLLPDKCTIDAGAGTVTLGAAAGDHLAKYNGLEKKQMILFLKRMWI